MKGELFCEFFFWYKPHEKKHSTQPLDGFFLVVQGQKCFLFGKYIFTNKCIGQFFWFGSIFPINIDNFSAGKIDRDLVPIRFNIQLARSFLQFYKDEEIANWIVFKISFWDPLTKCCRDNICKPFFLFQWERLAVNCPPSFIFAFTFTFAFVLLSFLLLLLPLPLLLTANSLLPTLFPLLTAIPQRGSALIIQLLQALLEEFHYLKNSLNSCLTILSLYF